MTTDAHTDQPDGPTDPVALVSKLWHQIWIDGELDLLDGIVTDPYVRHSREGTTTSTPAEYARHIESAVRTIRGTEVEIHATATAGDLVFARLNLHGVNMDTGNPVKLTWLAQYRVEGDRIAESWTMHQPGLDW